MCPFIIRRKRDIAEIVPDVQFNCEPDGLDAGAVELNTVSIGNDVAPPGVEERPVSFELATVV